MMKKVMLILSCLFLSIGLIYSQNITVSGVVVDDAGIEVVGASVVVKGTTTGVGTDIDGKFSLSAPSNSTLVFSLVGMKKKEMKAAPSMKVVMENDEALLDEVIVVGYGTAKKTSYTGSANLVDNKVMKDAPISNFESALQGAAPGLAVSSASGQPGAEQQINLRGVGSMNAASQPLYVIDGVPMVPENLSVSGVTNSAGSLGISSFINPSDIQNVTILKDAAAAALYGSRGSNGVIMITTKQGAEGAIKVSLKASIGFNDWAVENRPIMNGNDLRELWQEGYYNALSDDNYALIAAGKAPLTEAEMRAEALAQVNAAAPYSDRYSDWESALFRKRGSKQDYVVSVSGGNKTKFYLSLGHNGEKGKARQSEFKQYTGRLNLSHDAGDLKLGGNLSISKVDQKRVSEGSAYANPYYATRNYLLPTAPIYNEDGTYYEGALIPDGSNLVKTADVDQYLNDVFNTKAGIWAEYRIYDNLKIKETFTYDYYANRASTIWSSYGGNGAARDGVIIKLNPMRSKLYSSTLLTYDKTINKHTFDVLAGWDVEKTIKDMLQAVGSGYATGDITELAGAANPLTTHSQHDYDRMLSLLSRVNYSYDDKYYGSASFRRDGSSRFGDNKRWGTFWSVSGAWRVSKEEFMKSTEAYLQDLKLRASYGTSGNLPTEMYGSLGGYKLLGGSYNGKPGVFPARLANPDLSWEQSHTLDLGIEVKFLDNFVFEFDYYDKRTKDLLMMVPVSHTTGFSEMLQNSAEMSNKGYEIIVGYDLFNPNGVSWSTRFNIARNKNKIEKLYGGQDITSTSFYIRREGEAYNTLYTREFAGVDPANGDELWYTNNKQADGTIERELTNDPSKAQRTIVGKADPNFTGGWLNTVSYKGFDLSALFSFAVGGKFYDSGWSGDSNGAFGFTSLPSVRQLDRWQKPGDVTNVGRYVYGYEYGNYGSSKWVYSSTHLRLKNLAIGYTLPTWMTNHVKMSSVRFTAAATNLFTIKKAKGFDPEIPYDQVNKTTGTVGYGFPPLKTITFGVEVNF